MSEGLGYDQPGDLFANVYTDRKGNQYITDSRESRFSALQQAGMVSPAYRRVCMLHIRPKPSAGRPS